MSTEEFNFVQYFRSMGDKENLLINDLEEELPPEEEKLAEKKEEKVKTQLNNCIVSKRGI